MGKESCTAIYVQNRSPHRILGDKTPKEDFTCVKPEVSHLRIFGRPVYIHVPEEKRSKLEPSRKKGTFVGYSETSKAFKIYILGQRQIEVNWDVTFDEEVAFRRSKRSHREIDNEEWEAPRDANFSTPNIHPSDDQDDPVEPAELVDRPRDVVVIRKRPTWLRDTLQDAEKNAAPSGTFRESKRPQRFSSYMALMSHIIDSEPSNYEEAADQQVWKDAMMEEY